MSGVGPELPPHLLAKRKRQLKESAEDDAPIASGAKRSKSPSEPDKRPRVIGPAPPPAPLDERPTIAPDDGDESDSSDDDFGPALPTGPIADENDENTSDSFASRYKEESGTAPQQSKRDEWMMVPPKQDDLAARLDPTKLRARGFNTGKGAKGPAGGAGENAMWTETPEQKLKRLQDEAMGVKSTPQGPPRPEGRSRSKAAEEETERRIREHTEKTRGKSLYDQHQKTHDKETEDDPSKRAFDREKDMAAGSQIGNKQRKEMLSKAADFSSKFARGSFL